MPSGVCEKRIEFPLVEEGKVDLHKLTLIGQDQHKWTCMSNE